MKRIFAKSTLRTYWLKHADSEQYLKTWYDTVANSNWKSPNDVKKTYANASILKSGRIVFRVPLITHFGIPRQVFFPATRNQKRSLAIAK